MTLKRLKLSKIITPLNLVLAAIIIALIYMAYIQFYTWRTMAQMTKAAPGHIVKIDETQTTDLTVTLFYDYQCPFCIQIDPIIREAAAKDGKIELLFKFLPFFGDRSEQMAHMAFAAGKQDKFLALHDYFVAGGGRNYDDAEIQILTDELGLNHDQFVADMNSQAAKDKVQQNKDLAMDLRVYSTPTLYLGNTFYIPEGQMPNADELIELFNKARQRQ